MQIETLETPKIYIPPSAITLDQIGTQQIRLGIQGFPGTGKTWGALTFSNPIVLDIDRGLGAHRGKSNVVQVPIFSTEHNKLYYPTEPDNIKEVTLSWLRREGPKLTTEQTLIYDGLSGLEFHYHQDYKRHPVVSSRSGKVDDFSEWNLKVTYFNELCEEFKKLKCNVILITHEAERRDKAAQVGQLGEYTGKIRPLMTGQMTDRLSGHFTDWYRQLSATKPTDWDKIKDEDIKKNWRMSKDEFKGWCNSVNSNSIYYWRLESDDVFDGKCSSLVGFPTYLPADYNYFIKYLRK